MNESSEVLVDPGARMRTAVTVFISYASEDRAYARRLAFDLRAGGFEPWLDTEKLLPGDDWRREIEASIRNSTAFVALLSSQSISKRGFVQKELRTALSVLESVPPGDTYLLPARLEECQPAHLAIDEKQWVDLFPDWESGISLLIKSLKRLAGAERSLRNSVRSTPIPDDSSGGRPTDAGHSLNPWARLLLEAIALHEGGVVSLNVADDVVRLARRVGWPEATISELYLGAALRDIGKLVVPQHVILKAGRLDVGEFQAFREHTVRGEQLLLSTGVAGIELAGRVARCHHEKWNGTGYPDGLKNDEIPLEARLVAVVDVYYALCEARPYKPAWEKEKVMEIMQKSVATNFDPELVPIFLSMHESQ